MRPPASALRCRRDLYADDLRGVCRQRSLYMLVERKVPQLGVVIEFDRLTYTHPGTHARDPGFVAGYRSRQFRCRGRQAPGSANRHCCTAAGLLTPGAGGECDSICQERPGEAPARAVVFQDGRLLPWRTVDANVLPTDWKRLASMQPNALREVAEALQLTGWKNSTIDGRISCPAVEQRVGIARALAVKPDILLMDEPFSAVDALTRRKLQTELVHWQTTHSRSCSSRTTSDEAVYLADRVVVLGNRPATVVENLAIDLPRPRSQLCRIRALCRASVILAGSGIAMETVRLIIHAPTTAALERGRAISPIC